MKRILFVDDEPNVLAGLRRMLHGRGNEWDMAFAGGGEEALVQLERGPFDVIVSDMRMPKIDGAALLQQVQERYPSIVRVVLSGHTQLEAAMRAVPVAHQFLTKPCDAALLYSVVERACALGALLEDEELRAVVGEMDTLPSLPRTYAALTSALAVEDPSLADVAAIVERDVGMSAKVLQLVNSAFFALPRRVTGITQAVNYLGTNMLKNLALTVEAFQAFADVGRAGLDLEAFQDHAWLTGAIAKRLLDDQRWAEDAFTAAVLHDVGKLILASRLRERFERARAAARAGGRSLHHVETELGGTTHAELGAYLLGLWGLPYPIIEAVALHHTPGKVLHPRFDVLAAVHVADAMAHEVAPGADPHPGLDLAYLEALGVADRLPVWRQTAEEQLAAAA